MDCNTVLIKTRWLAMLRALKVQEEIQASSFSKSIFQDECFKAEAVIGAPRYLEGRAAIEKPRILEIDD